MNKRQHSAVGAAPQERNVARARAPEPSPGTRIGYRSPYEFAPTAAEAVQPDNPARRPIRLLRLPQVMDLIGLRRAAIYAMQAEGRFPRRVRLDVRAVGWIEDEVQAWLAKRVAENDVPPALKRHIEKTGGAAK
jgi:prophage regulatory protein